MRQRAAALLRLLGADDGAGVAAGAPRGSAPPRAATDLMGGLDEPEQASAAPAVNGPDFIGEQPSQSEMLTSFSTASAEGVGAVNFGAGELLGQPEQSCWRLLPLW